MPRAVRGMNPSFRFTAITVCLIALVALYTIFLRGRKIDNANLPSKLQSEISKEVVDARVLYVIPGGGVGSDHGYPLWTRQRVIAAFQDSQQATKSNKRSIFLALSAGSLNSPNLRKDDGRMVFECQHMIKHLKDLGVERERVYGDFISWDTAGNGLALRMFIEGLLAVSGKDSGNREDSGPLIVKVFISDFHAERVKATFNWILGLSPSLLESKVVLTIHSVSSEGVKWDSQEQFEQRVTHEKKGLEIIKKNAELVRSVHELYAFMLLGPHKGIFNYLHDEYKPSKGVGW